MAINQKAYVVATGEAVCVCGLPFTETSTTAEGTAYTLTATQAALDFGGTDPVIVIPAAGTYLISFWVVEQFNGATFAASRTITYKARRTNNTAADLTNGSTSHETGIITTLTTPGYQYTKYNIPYTGTLGDSITIFGAVSVLPTAGTVTVTAAQISALQVG